MAYWKEKDLFSMSHDEWENLCDGCGKCCLNKLEDEESGEVYYTNVRCKLLEKDACKCTNYLNRMVMVPSCVVLSPENMLTIRPLLPKSCSYRLVFEGQDLPDWHHLVCGDRERIHREGHSVSGKTISEQEVKVWEDQIIELPDVEPLKD